MFPNPQSALPLPPRPNVEQYKKLAKELVTTCNSGNPGAILEWSARWIHALAKLDAGSPVVTPPAQTLAQTNDRINQVAEFARRKLLRAGASSAHCNLSAAHFVIARSHGFENWSLFAKHLADLAHSDSAASQFELAADAIVSGDLQTLKRVLKLNSRLIQERSAREHQATLLHYVSANGVETYRQKTPKNIVAIAEFLLDAGADVHAKANVYGGESTALNLTATSKPPLLAGVQNEILATLLGHGATAETSLIPVCLAHGCIGAAQFLANHGIRLDVEGAAGVGKLDEVKSYFNEAGVLKPPANFQKLQRGFLWACEFGHNDVVEFLLANGADLGDQAGSNQTALHWAVIGGCLSTLDILLKHNAPLEELNAYGGTALGQALWSFLNGGAEIDYVAIVEKLLAAGAKIEDGSLAWLEKQPGRTVQAKAGIAGALRRYGAVT